LMNLQKLCSVSLISANLTNNNNADEHEHIGEISIVDQCCEIERILNNANYDLIALLSTLHCTIVTMHGSA